VTKALDALHLTDRFATIVSSEEYVNSKPAPDGFLLAAERLGVAPEDCLVFEDTDLGINAAIAAGMKWVRIAPPWERG
jgi:HAD superfamily hydrolase (TIGR01509 family)